MFDHQPSVVQQPASISMQRSGKTPDGLEVLPVGSSNGGRKQQYVWDGKVIKVIDTEELASKQTKRQHLSAQLRDFRSSVLSSFLPDKDLVTGDYWAYSFWRNSHRFFSSATTVFATQVSTAKPRDTVSVHALCIAHLEAALQQ